jgi:hypothetical protein
MTPTTEQACRQIIQRQQGRIAALEELAVHLRLQVAALSAHVARLSGNSSTSSKPVQPHHQATQAAGPGGPPALHQDVNGTDARAEEYAADGILVTRPRKAIRRIAPTCLEDVQVVRPDLRGATHQPDVSWPQ